MVRCCGVSPVLLGLAASATAIDTDTIRAVLQKYADIGHSEYNMSSAIGFFSPSLLTAATPAVTVAGGFTNEGLGLVPKGALRPAKPDDLYVWGSITKMFTGPAVLQLVDQGKVGLDDDVSQHADPYLMRVNGTSLSEHFGDGIKGVTIRTLLHMTSGVNDYDRANYTSDQFARPGHDFGPLEILRNYIPAKLRFPPGSRQSYCSANYILLGFVLANYNTPAASTAWQDFDQKVVFPSGQRASFARSAFVNKGSCGGAGAVPGIMAPSAYAATSGDTGLRLGLPEADFDVSNVSCTGGWTGGNYVGPVSDVARYTYELYRVKGGTIVSAASQANMINWTVAEGSGEGGQDQDHGKGKGKVQLGQAFKFYGMGTFNLDWSVTTAQQNITGYGHVGDTYGYQSQTTYFPALDFVITIATNVETPTQKQPAELTCRIFHALTAAMAGKADPGCSFHVPHDFIGTCSCPGSH